MFRDGDKVMDEFGVLLVGLGPRGSAQGTFEPFRGNLALRHHGLGVPG